MLDSKITEHILRFLILVVSLLLLNTLISSWVMRWDMTEDHRYSLSEPTKELLHGLNDDVYVDVYLAGDINSQFQRLQNAIKVTLQEFQAYAHKPIHFKFVNPDEAASKKARNQFYQFLAKKGIPPTTVFDNSGGEKKQKMIFPGAIIHYQGEEKSVLLLNGNKGAGAAQAINSSIENLEYSFASTLQSLTSDNRQHIGLLQGHGEANGKQIVGLYNTLQEHYRVDPVMLDSTQHDMDAYDALIMIGPKKKFSDQSLFYLDQYIMKGKPVLFFVDPLAIAMDSIADYGTIALPYQTGISRLLFQYGVRVNEDLLQDVNSGMFPLVVGKLGNNPQIKLMPWPYYLILNNYADHTITRNLDATYGQFVSSIDTVFAQGITKTPLIFTSDHTRVLPGPVEINFQSLQKDLKPQNFNKRKVPVAYLLEGHFTSLYANKFLPKGISKKGFIDKGKTNKLIVAGDANLLTNEINKKNGQPFPLGVDPYTKSNYANDQLVLNMLAYLQKSNGIIEARNKTIKIRPLDKVAVEQDTVYWQVINLGLPLVFLVLFGFVYQFVRKRRYR